MTIACKGAVLRAIGLPRPYAETRPLAIETIHLAPPTALDVVVKVGGAGLCHSDLSVINGDRGRDVPMVMGHEGAGEIVELGSAVTDLRVGEHVAFQFSVSCGRCRTCLGGRPNICEAAPAARSRGELLSGGSRITDGDGRTLRHQSGVSCFAEYAVVHRGSVVRIDDDLPLTTAAIFGCAVMTGVGAVVNTGHVRPGESVAIYGLGGVGLSGVMGAKVAGAATIVAIDLEDHKLDKAKTLGATHCFNARDPDLDARIREATSGGVDCALDFAGAIPALTSAYAVTVRGGTIVTAGLAPFGAKFAFEQGDLVSNEKSIRGSYMGSCVPVRDLPRFIKLYRSGALPVNELLDSVIGFDELNAGFDRLASGSAAPPGSGSERPSGLTQRKPSMPGDKPILFSPLTIRGVVLPNRIAVSPMAMYRAENGYPVAFHTVHYGKFAMGGAGLIYVEEAAIMQTGRITNGCLGLWEDGQAEALKPIAQFISANGAIPAIQINHGGRKGSAQRAWEGNGVLTAENIANGDERWQPVAPSDNPFADGWPVPTPLDRRGMDAIRDAFVATAGRALKAGFRIVELHMAHGYLLQSFLSPIANRRTDEYGGCLENRMRFPLEIARAVRASLPAETPLFARISAVDWIDGGWELDDSVALARELKAAGVDLVDCSSGGNLPKGATNSNLTRAPGYQAPFARRLREEAGILTQAVGLIQKPDFAEQLLQDGFADVVAIGRQMLYDPFWAHHAAEAMGQTGAFEAWPKPYAWWLDKWSAGLKATGGSPAA